MNINKPLALPIMSIRKTLFPILLILSAGINPARAQEKSPCKFGKVSPADFNLPSGRYDSGAEAVVIADIGSSEFLGNSKGWFSLEFKHYRRMKILNKKGFDAATVEIPLYVSGTAEEKLESLKAVTYNLEDGKVVETKLDNQSVFTDKISKHLLQKKFTFPALKEGSIIEYSFTQSSDFLENLQPWEFQGAYPCLWSEYEVAMPNFFRYVTLNQGFLPFNSNKSDERMTNFHVTFPGGSERDDRYSFDDRVEDHRWIMKDIPALKEENYTTTIDNYVSKIEFQLSGYNFPNSVPQNKMGNWVTVSQALMKDDQFGADLDRNNSWLDEDMKSITKGANGQMEKAKKIYAYVRDNFACTSHNSLFASVPLKTVYKNKNGSEAELNLLLTLMLNHEHISSDPVILSTRSHGFTHEMYPLLSRFNYVICRAVVDSSSWFLDASENLLGFGYIPTRCYNGHARIITNELARPIYLDADSVMEGRSTLVMLSNEGKGTLVGRYQSRPGYFGSFAIRGKVHEKGDKQYFKTIQDGYGGEMEVSNTAIDSLKLLDEPVQVNYDITWKPEAGADLLYFNPMLAEGYKENPFKAAERKYPVEMPCTMDENYSLVMDIPEGYEVEEMPKPAKVLFNDDEGFFEYLIQKGTGQIQFRSRVKLKKANFKPEDYSVLRDFFTFIVKKESEQIVFKKKK